MSLLFGRAVEARSEVPVPFDRGGAPLAPTASSALRLIPLYSATTGIADDVAVTPWHAYRESGEGYGERLARQPALLTDPTGLGVGLIPWMNQGVMSALLWGFALGVILQVDQAGWPTVVRWIEPSRVDIDETGPVPIFRIGGVVVDRASIVYVPGACLPGTIKGLSPISLFKLQFAKGVAAQRYAYETFDNGFMPPGVLRNTARTLPAGAADAAKSRFKAAVSGRDIFVTGNDWEWNALSVPDDDAKFLETIQATATEIAAIYRVDPEDIGGTSGSSLTYATVELNELKRQRRALLPWVRRFESVLTSLLPRPQYVKANMDALIRTELKARMEAHEIALRIGLETQDSARAVEDKPPLTLAEQSQWQNFYGARAGQQVTTSTPGGQA